MGLFGKSKEEIAGRRDIKRRVVEMLVTCGEIAPLAVSASMKLNGEQTGNVTVLAGGFWNNLTAGDRSILRSAKGCPVPRSRKSTGYSTLADFLEVPTFPVAKAGCMAEWTELGVLWAKQLVQVNPHSFPDRWTPFQQRIDRAVQRSTVDNQKYIRNPYGLGLPKNADQAFAYMVFQAGYLGEYEYPDKPAIAETQWKVLLKSIPREFVTPNIEALVNNKGFTWARKKCATDYGI